MKSIIDKNGYFTVQGWMSSILNLGGTELLIFAMIYSYSVNMKNNEIGQGFYGNQEFICQWFKLSKTTVISYLNKLVNKKYIIKEQSASNGFVKKYTYRANIDLLKKLKCIAD